MRGILTARWLQRGLESKILGQILKQGLTNVTPEWVRVETLVQRG